MNTSSIQLSPRHLLVRAGAALAGAGLLTFAAFTIGKPALPAGAAPAATTAPGSIVVDEAIPLDPDLVPRYGAAVRFFRAGDYAGAYGRFAELADRGHAASAQWALAMVSQGPLLFGSEWSATEAQMRRWSALSARDARERAVLIAGHDRGE
jgi:hypothetical protein